MKLKLVSTILSIAAVACFSLISIQPVDGKDVQSSKITVRQMVDPNPGGG